MEERIFCALNSFLDPRTCAEVLLHEDIIEGRRLFLAEKREGLESLKADVKKELENLGEIYDCIATQKNELILLDSINKTLSSSKITDPPSELKKLLERLSPNLKESFLKDLTSSLGSLIYEKNERLSILHKEASFVIEQITDKLNRGVESGLLSNKESKEIIKLLSDPQNLEAAINLLDNTTFKALNCSPSYTDCINSRLAALMIEIKNGSKAELEKTLGGRILLGIYEIQAKSEYARTSEPDSLEELKLHLEELSIELIELLNENYPLQEIAEVIGEIIIDGYFKNTPIVLYAVQSAVNFVANSFSEKLKDSISNNPISYKGILDDFEESDLQVIDKRLSKLKPYWLRPFNKSEITNLIQMTDEEFQYLTKLFEEIFPIFQDKLKSEPKLSSLLCSNLTEIENLKKIKYIIETEQLIEDFCFQAIICELRPKINNLLSKYDVRILEDPSVTLLLKGFIFTEGRDKVRKKSELKGVKLGLEPELLDPELKKLLKLKLIEEKLIEGEKCYRLSPDRYEFLLALQNIFPNRLETLSVVQWPETKRNSLKQLSMKRAKRIEILFAAYIYLGLENIGFVSDFFKNKFDILQKELFKKFDNKQHDEKEYNLKLSIYSMNILLKHYDKINPDEIQKKIANNIPKWHQEYLKALEHEVAKTKDENIKNALIFVKNMFFVVAKKVSTDPNQIVHDDPKKPVLSYLFNDILRFGLDLEEFVANFSEDLVKDLC